MYNRILTDKDRKKFANLIEEMKEELPEMMARKIDRANVQQAFIVDFVQKKYKEGMKILSVGNFEDTAFFYLKRLEYPIRGLSPELTNETLHDFVANSAITYDIVFATSVIEHVEDDVQFFNDMCSIVSPNGFCVLTMDYNDSWTPKMRKPATVVRFYTKADYARFEEIAKKYDCVFVDEFVSTEKPEFTNEGCTYNFSTMVFRRVK